MALLNNIYVLVTQEELNNDVETVTHPTETGFPTASSVRKSPISLSISGKIANTDELTATEIIEKLKKLQTDGSLIKYEGQCGTIENLQIQSFRDSYGYKNYGGADFSMSLIEVKIAKSAYVEPETEVEETTVETTEPKEGDLVTFLGGEVYLSSDAKKTIFTREGGSECKLTKISTLEGATHIYHLISQDCKFGNSKYVYGWVDKENVQLPKTEVAPETNGGTQQISNGLKQRLSVASGEAIYHTVKKGETIWGLVTKTYKSYGFTTVKVVKDNPDAFSKPNDVTTLKVGAKLKLSK